MQAIASAAKEQQRAACTYPQPPVEQLAHSRNRRIDGHSECMKPWTPCRVLGIFHYQQQNGESRSSRCRCGPAEQGHEVRRRPGRERQRAADLSLHRYATKQPLSPCGLDWRPCLRADLHVDAQWMEARGPSSSTVSEGCCRTAWAKARTSVCHGFRRRISWRSGPGLALSTRSLERRVGGSILMSGGTELMAILVLSGLRLADGQHVSQNSV